MFLKNAWYVAAWSSEVGRTQFERIICDQSILFYRTEGGDPVAVSNACPHRYAPLSMGVVVGDDIRCGYHGMRFGPDGVCNHNPLHGSFIPEKMRLRAYPVQERHDMIWIWLGRPSAADPDKIPDFSFNTDPNFRRIGGMFEVAANYELISDNILDLTHAEFVHPGVLSSVAITKSKLKTAQNGSTIWSNRWIPDGDAPPAWRVAFNDYQENVDQWGYTRWDVPAHMVLDIGMTPVGKSRAEGIWLYGTDILTPKNATTTYYFWGFTRNYAIDDENVDKMWEAAIDVAFVQQDKPIIEGQQRMLGSREIGDVDPVIVSSDVASGRVRRLLKSLIAQEATDLPSIELGAEPPLEMLARNLHTASPVEPAV